MQGMTIKQAAMRRFYMLLGEYKAALDSKDSTRIVYASLAIHAAKGEVPKHLWPLVNRAFRGER